MSRSSILIKTSTFHHSHKQRWMHLEIQWLVNAYYSTLSIPVRHPLLMINFLTLSPRFNKVVSLPLQPPAFLFCICLWWCLWLLMKGPATSTSFLRCKVYSALAAGSGCVFCLFVCLVFVIFLIFFFHMPDLKRPPSSVNRKLSDGQDSKLMFLILAFSFPWWLA